MLGKKLKELRKARNLKQDDIAHLFNVTRGNISNWENGRRNPSVKQLEALAKFYNISMDFFAEETKQDETIELLDRARKLLKDDNVSQKKKEQLYTEIMRLYLELKSPK